MKYVKFCPHCANISWPSFTEEEFKKLVNNNDKILSEDDFISLEDKMKQFEIRKMQINHPERKIVVSNEEEDEVNLGNSGLDEIKIENKDN